MPERWPDTDDAAGYGTEQRQDIEFVTVQPEA